MHSLLHTATYIVHTSGKMLHYQKMIVAMVETGKLMKEIDEVVGESGGFPLQ